MGKVDRLHNKVEPFAALFWACLTPDPARRPGITQQPYTKHLLICFNSQGRHVAPAPFSYLGILFIYALESRDCPQCPKKKVLRQQ